ncbi:MAG TPA: DNA polymerase III subunit gamma/tau [Pirellulales bacterium]|nr:DNA polymerase III subunit gamma/tau [Pirellulales bacterium]
MAVTNAEKLDQATPAADGASSSGGTYVVVARRYRPQAFDQLVGQEHVARALSNAIAANRVGHAYLFSGARGVGKTSAARILAKALNCAQGPTPAPCNHCDLCLSVNAGSDVDVLEIDGASNRGIDEIRQLRQNVNIRPSRARFKIYIIDEVHMLTREAFNALLKTLEEPPEHVKFIFCTTEPTKIPVTILSRCQRFDFAGIQAPSIVERLRQIVAAEGVSADSEALEILARRAGGSMRDSQSLLEQLLAFGGPRITATDVHAMLGTAGATRLAEFVARLVDRDAAAAITLLDAAVTEGVDVGQLVEQLLGYFRDMLTAAVGCTSDALLYATPGEHDDLAALGKSLGIETILAVMQILDQTLSRLRYTTQGRTLVEMALVRIANLENLDELSHLIAELREPGAAGAALTGRPDASTMAGSGAKKKAELRSPGPGLVDNSASAPSSGPLAPESVLGIWKLALARLDGLLPGYAETCQSVTVGQGDRLVVTFTETYTSCKAFCEQPAQRSMLEAALAEVAGRKLGVDFALTQGEKSAAVAASPVPPPRTRIAEHPLVRRAGELFDARLVGVEEATPQRQDTAK